MLAQRAVLGNAPKRAADYAEQREVRIKVPDRNVFEVGRSASSAKVRRILFIAPMHAFYQSACRAFESYFTGTAVDMIDALPGPDFADATVDLVLLAAQGNNARADLIRGCRQQFPRASIVLIADGAQFNTSNELPVQGILQANLPLEVWFAVVQLVLAGGEYLFHESRAPSPPGPTTPAPPTNVTPIRITSPAGETAKSLFLGHDMGGPGPLSTLTPREWEILNWISEGYQNKLIANRMALSEHTVKAHVHNLISKLHVTNRTQAAAVLHEQKQGTSHGQGAPR
jgi:DNA-binding NarL/FixJ family response regulator